MVSLEDRAHYFSKNHLAPFLNNHLLCFKNLLFICVLKKTCRQPLQPLLKNNIYFVWETLLTFCLYWWTWSWTQCELYCFSFSYQEFHPAKQNSEQMATAVAIYKSIRCGGLARGATFESGWDISTTMIYDLWGELWLLALISEAALVWKGL